MPRHRRLWRIPPTCRRASFWNRNHVESVQITMAEDFGVQGRGAFYDETGTIRDVVQNHLFQVLANSKLPADAYRAAALLATN